MKTISRMSGWMAAAVLAAGCAGVAGAQGATVPEAHYRAMRVLKVATAAAAQQGGGDTANIKDDLFQGTEVFAKGASDVTEITMDPDTLDLVGGKDSHRAHNMVLNVVRTYEYDKPGMYNMADVDAFRNKLNTGEWHCSVHVRELKTGESTDVCNKKRSDDLVETAIISVEPKELTFIHTIRRRGGPGESEMGELPLMPGMMAELPVLAMLTPEMMRLQMSLGALQMDPMRMKMHIDAGLRGVDGAKMKAQMDAAQKAMREAQKEMNSPEFQKQMQEQMKNLKLPAPEAAPLPPTLPTPEVPATPTAPAAPEATPISPQ